MSKDHAAAYDRGVRRRSRRAVLTTGMHRSGTSMVAAMVERAGVDMGGGFPAPDHGNPHGYFEDHSMLKWQRQLLTDAVGSEPVGHPDWGWVQTESLDWELIDGQESDARRLLATRSRTAGGLLGEW